MRYDIAPRLNTKCDEDGNTRRSSQSSRVGESAGSVGSLRQWLDDYHERWLYAVFLVIWLMYSAV